EAFSALGQVYQRQGRTGEALEQFTRAIQLRPNWAPLYRGRADVLLGLKDLSRDQCDAVISDLESAIRAEPPGSPAIAADRVKQTRVLHRAGRLDEALGACDGAMKMAPRFAPAHLLRIRILLDQKHYDDLLRSCDIALETTKPSAGLLELRGM